MATGGQTCRDGMTDDRAGGLRCGQTSPFDVAGLAEGDEGIPQVGHGDDQRDVVQGIVSHYLLFD